MEKTKALLIIRADDVNYYVTLVSSDLEVLVKNQTHPKYMFDEYTSSFESMMILTFDRYELTLLYI